MKTHSMSIKNFMKKEEESFSAKVERHIKKYGKVYKTVGKVAGVTLVVITAPSIVVFAADPSITASGVGIGPAAKSLYMQLVSVGKWIIIFKGGFDTIKNIGNGDFEAAKKNFFAYLLTYLFLLALPYGMDQVEKVVNAASANQ